MQYANGYIFDRAYSRMYIKKMTIAERLDAAMMRQHPPIGQSELARMSGVSQPTINRILQNKTPRGPETNTIKKLAAALNVSFEWLMEGIESSNKDSDKLLAYFIKINDDGRAVLLGMAKSLSQTDPRRDETSSNVGMG